MRVLLVELDFVLDDDFEVEDDFELEEVFVVVTNVELDLLVDELMGLLVDEDSFQVDVALPFQLPKSVSLRTVGSL